MTAQWMLTALAGAAILCYTGLLWKLCSDHHSYRPRHAALGEIVDPPGFMFSPSRNESGGRFGQPARWPQRWLPCSDPQRPFCGVLAKHGKRRHIAHR